MKIRLLLFLSTVLLLQICFVQCSFGQSTKPLQHFWEVAPDFGDIWNSELPERVIHFDVESLNSTRVQERVEVARMICREYKNSNFKPKERALELLLSRLAANEESITSRRAMISAATLLDDGKNAARLWEVAQADTLSRTTVEKALTKWKSPVATEVWRKRLTDPLANAVDIGFAIEGLAVVGGSEDTVALQGVLRGNNTTVTNRHLAAIALGQLNQAGLNDLAQQVLASDLEQPHLLAAELLSRHTGEMTVAQLRTIFTDGANVAQYFAAKALFAHFPEVVREYAPQMVEHADSTMRILALNLLDKLSDEASLRLQAKLLNDRNADIRRLAGTQLIRHAAEGQRQLVDEFVTEHINAEPWPGIEQAIIMAVSLQDASRCAKFVELLEHAQPEVNMHAGWALMELARDSAILASIEPHVEKATAFMVENGVKPPLYKTDTIRLSYLLEAFGRNKYEPMHKLLMKYVPKNDFKMGYASRASAIWALGQINNGKDNRELREALFERIADGLSMPPEDYLVRFGCILALGEMGFADSLPTLKRFNDGIPYPIGYACDWATEQIEKANPK
jgi:HEAT repeat protein